MVWHVNVIGSCSTDYHYAGQQPKNFTQLAHSYWKMYCERSSIHGVRYLCDPKIRLVERIIWSALIATSVVLTSISYIMLTDRYGSKNLQTVVQDSQFPVFYMHFPAVSICTNNRINWLKFEQSKRTFLPVDADNKTINSFIAFVEHMETMRFGNFGSFQEIEDLNLEQVDFLNVTQLATFLSLNCEDIFYENSCHWRGVSFNCCEEFVMENTERGLCLVFNSIYAPNDSKSKWRISNNIYPHHNSRAGQGTGLNLRLHLNNKFRRPKSSFDDTLFVMIKKTDQWSGTGYDVIPNTASYLLVRPEITETDESTRHMTPEQRNCIFSDENSYSGYDILTGAQYRRANCMVLCHEEHLIKLCNCTLPLYFRNSRKGVQHCKPSDFRCLAKNNDVFSYDKHMDEEAVFHSVIAGMTCSCLISCKSVEFFTSLTMFPVSKEMLPKDPSVSVFEIDVHYQSEVMVKYRTSLEFTITDLIANLGGIISLCLGASMVSAVELIYHLTIGFSLYLHDNNYWSTLILVFPKWRLPEQNPNTEDNQQYKRTACKGHFCIRPLRHRKVRPNLQKSLKISMKE